MCLFVADFIIQFLIKPQNKADRGDLSRFLKFKLKQRRLWLDLVTLLPLPRLLGGTLVTEQRFRLLYLIKVVRVEKAFSLLCPKAFVRNLKLYHEYRVSKQLKKEA